MCNSPYLSWTNNHDEPGNGDLGLGGGWRFGIFECVDWVSEVGTSGNGGKEQESCKRYSHHVRSTRQSVTSGKGQLQKRQ